MNTRILLRKSVLLVAILGSFFSVSSVAASELILPDELVHEGLTFSSGLHYSSHTRLSEVKTITFMTNDEGLTDEAGPSNESEPEPEPALFVQATTKDEVFAEEIVLPTPKHETPTPTPTVTKKSTPTMLPATPTPTKAPETTPTPTPVPATPAAASSLPAYATNGTLNPDVMFSMVNQKRAEAGLPAFEKNAEVCAVAESRKPEIENEVYGSSSIHAGFRARDLPFRASENMISQNSEEAAINWWMNSSIHRAGILGGSKYACVACQNKTCAMIMSSLDPK